MANTVLRWGMIGAVVAAAGYLAAGMALLVAAARAGVLAAPGHPNHG